MQALVKCIIATVFCLLFVIVKITNAQYKALESSCLDNDGLLQYPSIVIDNATILPKNISSLLVLILNDNTKSLVKNPKLKLIGKNNNDQYFDLGDLRYDSFLRTDEAVAFFEKKNRLHVGSRLRGGFLFWNEYIWNGKKATWLRISHHDPRDEYLTTLPLATKNYLAQGNINKAIEVISKNKRKYDTKQLGLEFLKYSDKIARKMQREGKTIKACNFMEEIFELNATEIDIPNFNDIKNSTDYDKAIFGDIESYSSLSFDEYLQLVANYAVLLQQSGQLDRSVEILKQLTTIAPDKADFYLYLADSFWLLNSNNEAITSYSSYISKIRKDFPDSKIAKRALLRTNINNQLNP